MKKLLIAIAALAMFASSVHAADWDFYGNVRFYNFWTKVENTNNADDAKDLDWNMSPYSRIGANIKVSDELKARFEGDALNGSLRIRHLWGEWNFGPGSLRIGQDYAPTYIWGSNQLGGQPDNFELGLGGYGEMGGGRVSQIKLIFGGLHIAFMQPSTSFNDLTFVADTETTLPALAVSYRMSGDAWNVKGVGAYQTFDIDDEGASSYLIGIGGDISFASFTLYGSIHGGENIGNLQNGIASGNLSSNAYWDGTTVYDVESIAYRLVGNYKFNDMVAFEIGYGYGENEVDSVDIDDEVESYYVNMPITLAPGVTVTPEIGIVDEKEDGQDDTTYYGLHWRINF